MKVNADTAPHSTWQEVCDAWQLMSSDGLCVKQERMPPGTAEQLHHHAAVRQFFFVLSGVLTLEVEGVSNTLHPQEGLEVPPRRRHQARNEGQGDVQFLVISSPPVGSDRHNS